MAFTRKIDDLGRVTLPMEYRKAYGVEPGDLIAFDFSREYITLHPQKPLPKHENEQANMENTLLAQDFVALLSQLNTLEQQRLFRVIEILSGLFTPIEVCREPTT